ncbi:MAG TPA: gamma-glutamylcyclotransferase family protein [Terracidiphilus sp.]|nr:gamma-glutamylcyclotransferase family protein [Terracidiphilus sp.]
MAQSAFIFGYGSLLERASRTRTNPEAIGAWPARVTGYRRGWFHQFAGNVGSTCTYLGAVAEQGATINGVIYKVNDFEKTRERETGYTATPVSGKIEMLDGGKPWGSDEVWLFISNPEDISPTKEPTPAIPMVESYVDICINGCLEIEASYRTASGFTQEFIQSTSGWNKFWVNDRLYPRRPFIYIPNAGAIDQALQTGGVLKYVQLHDPG